MSETYCGKSCAECAQKELLNCTGCKAGQGRLYGGDCELARCIRDKGHVTCDTCNYKVNCGKLRSRDHMADYRLKKMKAEEMRQAAIAKRAPVLGRWLWILFWLIVPSTIGSLMANESIAQVLPGLFMPGQVINAVCILTYGAILFKLGSEEDRYRTAGICALIAGVLSTAAAVADGSSSEAAWTLLLTIPAAILGLVSEYNEYLAHAIVLTGVDNEQSVKWENLWKWYIGLFLGMLGCIVLMLIIPFLGAIAFLGAAVGLLIVGILKLVYLYRTARIFRAYSADCSSVG